MTPGVSALTNRAAVIVKTTPSRRNAKINPVIVQAAATTSRKPAGLQTAASHVDTPRVIIKKIIHDRAQKSTDGSGRCSSDTDRFACQQGQLSLLLRSFVSNCPAGGYELPVSNRRLRTARDSVLKQTRVNR